MNLDLTHDIDLALFYLGLAKFKMLDIHTEARLQHAMDQLMVIRKEFE